MQLQPTGVFDKQTRCLMRNKRCGESDIKTSANYSDYYLRKENLTYFVRSWSSLMPMKDQNNTIVNAFYSLRKILSRRINLDWKSNRPDILINFVKGNLHTFDS